MSGFNFTYVNTDCLDLYNVAHKPEELDALFATLKQRAFRKMR